MKELEKIASKRKGIVSQSVKEVLQSLVDDNLVNTDKCGVQTVFWSLPSEASQKKKAKLQQVTDQLDERQRDEDGVDKEIESLSMGREKTNEWQSAMQRVEELGEGVSKVDRKLQRFAQFDPVEMKKISEGTHTCKVVCNRWIDNVFTLQAWTNSHFMMEKKDFYTQFGIAHDLDYME